MKGKGMNLGIVTTILLLWWLQQDLVTCESRDRR